MVLQDRMIPEAGLQADRLQYNLLVPMARAYL